MPDSKILQQWVDLYQVQHIFVGFSGGVDSSALLHLCSYLDINITALHINHGLSIHANTWQQHCQQQAKSYGINFESIQLQPPDKLRNIEAWAREQRFAFFTDKLTTHPNSILFTAHHQQDQAETFLLNALRGSGIMGLSGIKPDQPFAKGHLIRPLLDYTKKQLQQYCRKHAIDWIEDESNNCVDLRRNAIRHKILPELEGIQQNASALLSRSTMWCQEAQSLLDHYLQKELHTLFDENKYTLALSRLKNFSKLQQKHLIQHWLNNILDQQYHHRQLQQILQGVENACANWCYRLSHWQFAIQNKRLLATKINGNNLLTAKTDLTQPDTKTIIDWLNIHSLNFDVKTTKLIFRQRQPGDRCRYPKRQHKQKLKILFQELDISANKRQKAIIICQKAKPDDIVAVYPFFVCPEFLSSK
ncbi:tRNA lysidine(34) synthetase TilS [Facilibium subflavum]|uniref:tRNA lysidine(34) synthetase TilS n=1 Tax=Facilibium subflavum TaxID=2219058 RepID=UPI0013C333FC|nr:tRNA lysidine(34) synthetase TilS [Facilibium subflavum]